MSHSSALTLTLIENSTLGLQDEFMKINLLHTAGSVLRRQQQLEPEVLGRFAQIITTGPNGAFRPLAEYARCNPGTSLL